MAVSSAVALRTVSLTRPERVAGRDLGGADRYRRTTRLWPLVAILREAWLPGVLVAVVCGWHLPVPSCRLCEQNKLLSASPRDPQRASTGSSPRRSASM